MRKRPQLTELGFDRWSDQLREWIQASVSPFEADTPFIQAARKERARRDRLYFFETYLPHYFTAPFAFFHQEWSALADLSDQAVFVAAPREHGKSAFFSFGLPIHDLCYEARHFILIISDTNDQAAGFTLPIRLELEENPRLLHDFGPFEGRTWKQNDFTTARGVRVLARGRGERVRGLKNLQYRPDRAIVDDFENDANVRNPLLVTQGLNWLRQAVMGSLAAGYGFIMVGNLFAPNSILSRFMAEADEQGPLYKSRIYRALDDNGRPLWEKLWPPERLEKKRRQMGTVAFGAEMLNQVGAEESPFKETWFVFIEHPLAGLRGMGVPSTSLRTVSLPNGSPMLQRQDGRATPGGFETRPYRVASFLDPSAKSGMANDYKAIITVGLDPDVMKFDVLHAWIRRAAVSEMIEACYRVQAAFGGPLGLEINMLEDFLREVFSQAARERGRYLPLAEVRHTVHKEGRIIAALSPLVEFGRLRFVKGHSDQDRLVEQLVYILDKNVNDDGPDALEGAVSLLMSGAGGAPGYETVQARRGLAKGGY